MFDFGKTCGEADGLLRRLIGMSFRLGYSLAGCSPAEPASAFPTGAIVQRYGLVRQAILSGRYVSNFGVSQKRPQSIIRVHPWLNLFFP